MAVGCGGREARHPLGEDAVRQRIGRKVRPLCCELFRRKQRKQCRKDFIFHKKTSRSQLVQEEEIYAFYRGAEPQGAFSAVRPPFVFAK